MDKFKNFRRTDRKIRPLKLNPKAQCRVDRLPNVKGNDFWAVPATGGYFGGYKTGEALARILLKVDRDSPTSNPITLTSIVFSMLARFHEAGGAQELRRVNKKLAEENDGMEALRGQLCGFFNTIHCWAAAGAQRLGANLDKMSMEELTAAANAGLMFDNEAYMAMLKGQEYNQEETAEQAAA